MKVWLRSQVYFHINKQEQTIEQQNEFSGYSQTRLKCPQKMPSKKIQKKNIRHFHLSLNLSSENPSTLWNLKFRVTPCYPTFIQITVYI